MWAAILFPFLLQGICMAFDEGYFHIRRGLPKWERIGHPLDTITVLICFLWILLVPFSALSLKIYIVLAAFSTIFVTKDEFVHKEHCPASEAWLHAVLFTLHPITLALAGLIWYRIGAETIPNWLQFLLTPPFPLSLFLWGECILMGLFCIYQILFWNFIWKEKKAN